MYVFRRLAMVMLAFGVVAGYGSAFASFRHHRAACHGQWSEQDRWGDRGEWRGHGGWSDRDADSRGSTAVTPPPAPAAIAPVVATPAASSPNVFIIMPGASTPPAQVIQVPAPNVAPAAATP